MMHGARCELSRTLVLMAERYKDRLYCGDLVEETRWRDALRGLMEQEDLCACLAREWVGSIPLGVGFRIAERKAERYLDAWRESWVTPLDVQVRRFTDRINGFNVINLSDHQASR